MTLSADEKLPLQGQPIELYSFTLAGNSPGTYAYTSHLEDTSDGLSTFTSVNMRRSEIKIAEHTAAPELLIQMEADNAMVRDIALQTTPPRDVQVWIRRFHTNLSNLTGYWRGVITSVSIRNGLATLRSPSVLSDTLTTPVPAAVGCQALCNHRLYDDRCTVVDTANDFATTVSSISADGKTVTVASVDGEADQVFRAGYIKRTADSEKRLIVDQSSTALTISPPFNTIAASDAVVIFKGCDHTINICGTKFSNIVNFGGFAFVPDINLFSSGLLGSLGHGGGPIGEFF